MSNEKNLFKLQPGEIKLMETILAKLSFQPCVERYFKAFIVRSFSRKLVKKYLDSPPKTID